MYGLGEVGAVTKVLLLLLVGKDIVEVLQNLSNSLGCRNGTLPPLFIGFDLNTSSNSHQLPVLHVTTLFLLSIDCVHPHILSSTLSTVFSVLIFCASILLLLHILLLH